MRLSLIIPAYNEEQYIGECINSALRNAHGRFHEIIVVDNASTDRTLEAVRSRPGIRIVYEPCKGITHARQRGFEKATGDVLAYIDADTRIPPNWIRIVETTFNHSSDVVCLSGPYRYYDGPRPKRWLLGVICRLILPIGQQLFGCMVIGGNFVATKKAINEVGGFDRTIDFFGEDTDIGRQLSLRGKIQFRMDFFINTSARRFYAEGLIRANAVYLINFVWIVLFHRPFSTSHRDIRTVYDPKK